MQRGQIGGGEERVVVFAEAHGLALELARDEGMAVQIVGGLERQEGADAHHQGAEHLVPDVEVVVRVARPLPRHDSVVWVVGGVLSGRARQTSGLVPGS